RIAIAPYLTRSGALVQEPGYNIESKVFYAPQDSLQNYDPLTLAEAKTLVLVALLGDFPLQDARSQANAVACFVKPFICDGLRGRTPMFVAEKATPGSGGTLLMDMLLWPFIGREVTKNALPQGRECDEELRKVFTSVVRGGAPVL